MNNTEKIKETSDSLIGLLASQCLDLEVLFGLAQRETAAAERKDFETILAIVTERTRIAQKFETYQQQIAEFRRFLGNVDSVTETYPVTARIIELTEQTLAQDRKTRELLTGVREETCIALHNLAAGKRSVNVYLREEQRGLRYDESI